MKYSMPVKFGLSQPNLESKIVSKKFLATNLFFDLTDYLDLMHTNVRH